MSSCVSSMNFGPTHGGLWRRDLACWYLFQSFDGIDEINVNLLLHAVVPHSLALTSLLALRQRLTLGAQCTRDITVDQGGGGSARARILDDRERSLKHNTPHARTKFHKHTYRLKLVELRPDSLRYMLRAASLCRAQRKIDEPLDVVHDGGRRRLCPHGSDGDGQL